MQRPFSPYARPAESGLRNSIRFGDQADAADPSSTDRGPSALPEVLRQSHIQQAEHSLTHHRESDHAHVDFRRTRIAHLQRASEDFRFVDIGKMAALLNSGLDEGGQDSDADNSAPSGVERVPLEIQIL